MTCQMGNVYAHTSSKDAMGDLELVMGDSSHGVDMDESSYYWEGKGDGIIFEVGEEEGTIPNVGEGGDGQSVRLVPTKAADDSGPIVLIQSKQENAIIYSILEKYDMPDGMVGLNEEEKRSLVIRVSCKRRTRASTPTKPLSQWARGEGELSGMFDVPLATKENVSLYDDALPDCLSMPLLPSFFDPPLSPKV
ncbi:hypothetical protein GH714_029452 [Hevea brasiliensis]|uniref:Uncharacterized protein n=1 Tax=Hevea brasiliensis TaxID=3981 RepID=A0A6A6NBC6_HEVBR|nr:hypothetical protein GH714_029452 [Hevea brasiliensis]